MNNSQELVQSSVVSYDTKKKLADLKEQLLAAEEQKSVIAKAQLEETILKLITVDNSVEIFIFARNHMVDLLEQVTSNFIRDHFNHVSKTIGWIETERKLTNLGRLILESLGKFKRESK